MDKQSEKKKPEFNLELEIEELEMQIDPISLCSGGPGDPFFSTGHGDPFHEDPFGLEPQHFEE